MIQGAGCSWGEWITWFPTWLRCPRKCQIPWLDYYSRDAGSGYGGHGRGRESPWPFPSWFLMTWMVVWLYLPSLSATIVLPGLFCSSWLIPPEKAEGCLLRVGSERRRCRRLFPLSVPIQQIRWLWCWEVLGGVTGIFLLFCSKYGSCKLQGGVGGWRHPSPPSVSLPHLSVFTKLVYCGQHLPASVYHLLHNEL